MEFNYQMLARFQRDFEYYFGFGCLNKKHLFYGDELEQIAKMKELYNGLEEKPDWCSYEQILDYEQRVIYILLKEMANETLCI